MKKRWMGLALAILLAASPVLCTLAGAESELMYKMQRQLDAGSGLKGTVTASGVNGLDGLTLNAQYILQKAQSQTVLALRGSDGGELVKTILYGQDDTVLLDAELNSGMLYSFSGGWESLLGRLLAGETSMQMTPAYTALLSIFFPEDENKAAKLTEAAAPYLTKIDLWMQGFAKPAQMEKDASGVTVMKVSYHIPAAAFKAELKQLLLDLLADESLLPLLWEMMTQEQADLYLNPALQSFYFQAVDALPLSGEITMLRRISTTGKLMETSVILPLSSALGGLAQLSFSSKAMLNGDLLDCTLVSEQGTLEITAQKTETAQADTVSYTGLIRYLPAEIPNWQVDATTPQYTGKALSVSYQASYTTKLSVDAQGRSSESYSLTVDIIPDWSHLKQEVTDEIKGQYVLTEPVKISGSILLESGKARNASTSLKAEIHFGSSGTDAVITGQFKTTPPWNYQQVDVAAAEKLENLTQDQRNALVMEFFSKPGLLPLLTQLVPLDQQVPGSVG